MYKLMAFGAACFFAAAPWVNAAPDDQALLDQIKQIASQGQNAQTSAQVNKNVDQNKSAIIAVLKAYLNYYQQIQKAAGDDEPQSANSPQSTGTSAAPAAPPPQAPTPGSQAAAAAPPSDASQSGSGMLIASASKLQASTNLQPASGLQPSTGLQTSHLSGYPALPDVDAVSSVTSMSLDQIAYSLQVQKENQARKQYLMQHPEGYSY